MANRRSRHQAESSGRATGELPQPLSHLADPGTGEAVSSVPGADGPARAAGWRARRLDLIVGLAAAGYAAYVTGTVPFSVQADVAVAIPLVLVVAGSVVSWRSWQRVDVDSLPLRAVAPWAVLVLATVVWEVVNYVMQPRSDHPTLSSMSDHAMSSRPSKAVFVFVWLIAGWALVSGWRRWHR